MRLRFTPTKSLFVLVCGLCWLTAAPAQVVDLPPLQPVDDAQFEQLRWLYDYTAALPLNPKITASRVQDGTKIEYFQIDSENGEHVPGVLILPPSQRKRPLLLVLHGLGMNKDMITPIAPALGPLGVDYAIIALDAQYQGDRKQPGKDIISTDLNQVQRAFIQTVIDYRRALDYAASRPEIDTSKVGVVGLSMGAIMGSLLTAVEPRVATATLLVGGGDWARLLFESPLEPVRAAIRAVPTLRWEEVRTTLALIDPVNFASHFGTRPVLLLNAQQDQVIPRASAEALHAAATGAGVVKEWVEADHLLQADATLLRVMTWMRQHLR